MAAVFREDRDNVVREVDGEVRGGVGDNQGRPRPDSSNGRHDLRGPISDRVDDALRVHCRDGAIGNGKRGLLSQVSSAAARVDSRDDERAEPVGAADLDLRGEDREGLQLAFPQEPGLRELGLFCQGGPGQKEQNQEERFFPELRFGHYLEIILKFLLK